MGHKNKDVMTKQNQLFFLDISPFFLQTVIILGMSYPTQEFEACLIENGSCKLPGQFTVPRPPLPTGAAHK
jgi:hypothetical protein